jgi:hypothetical protein
MAKPRYHNPDGIVEVQKERSVVVHFESKEHLLDFIKKTGQLVTNKTKEHKFVLNSPMDEFFK